MTHRTIYLTLTDGHIFDHNYVNNLCQRISLQQAEDMPEPIFYMCALGEDVSMTQLEELVLSANKKLCLNFHGQFLCDLLVQADKSEQGMECLQERFRHAMVESTCSHLKILCQKG
jgi:hypothetical protein